MVLIVSVCVQQQQQWPNYWNYEGQSQWPQQYYSPCGGCPRRCHCHQGFSPFWFWCIKAEKQREMRRRWLRWFLWKKYMMQKKCFCRQSGCCGKNTCCRTNPQKENDKKENSEKENDNQNSQPVFSEKENPA